MKTSCKFYSFLRAVRGNWRNAIFVSCGCDACMYGREKPCSGFLLTVDECGQVMLLPAETVHELTGEEVEPAECSASCRAALLTPLFPSTSNGMRRTLPHVRSGSFVWPPAAARTADFYTERRHRAAFGASLEVMIL